MRMATFVLTVILAFGSTSSVNAQSESGETALKTAHEFLMSAVKSGNLTMLGAMTHPKALGFFRQRQSAAQLGSEYSATDALPAFLTI
jgi:hypothetical protein